MNHATVVRSRQTGAGLTSDLGCFVGREAANATHQGGQVLAVNIFHGQESNAICIADVEHAANVGMGDLPSDAHFGMKTRKCTGILGNGFRQKLYGYDLAEFEVFGAVDFAHATAPRKSDDAIALGHNLPRDESSAADGIRA